MSWKNILKLDRAKLRRREEKRFDEIDELTQLPEEDRKYMKRRAGSEFASEELIHEDAIREKRKKSGLSVNRTPRSKREHRMNPKDRPKPRRTKPNNNNPFFATRKDNPSDEAFAEFDEEQRERGKI